MGIDTPPQAEAGNWSRSVPITARRGVAQWNPRTNIRLRMMDRDPAATIDAAWFARASCRIRRSQGPPFTRRRRRGSACCITAEADGVPGLVVDRYTDVVVFQISTAGMDRLRGCRSRRDPCHVGSARHRRNGRSRRASDGGVFDQPVAVQLGSVDGPVPFWKQACVSGRMSSGQKTGFFLTSATPALPSEARGRPPRPESVQLCAGAFGVITAAGDASASPMSTRVRSGARVGRTRASRQRL